MPTCDTRGRRSLVQCNVVNDSHSVRFWGTSRGTIICTQCEVILGSIVSKNCDQLLSLGELNATRELALSFGRDAEGIQIITTFADSNISTDIDYTA